MLPLNAYALSLIFVSPEDIKTQYHITAVIINNVNVFQKWK